MTTQSGTSLRALAGSLGAGPLMVHSDVVEVRGLAPLSRDRARVLDAHLAVLSDLARGRELWFPAFNYDFTRTGRFDLRASPSQVGVLSEHFRSVRARWRTPVPVFSIAGTGDAPPAPEPLRVDPFGVGSAFDHLVRRDGTVLFYGAPMTSGTFLHHVERAVTGPPYRYDKYFRGTIVHDDRDARAVELEYHVRPMGRHLDYDWVRLARDLRTDGLLVSHPQPGVRVHAFRCGPVLARWRERLTEDPLYLLDAASRAWVEPMLDRLGRRFVLEDFEPSWKGERVAGA